jgi:hypothetical protein
MTTHFITTEIDLQESPRELQKAIETELEKRGDPYAGRLPKSIAIKNG